MKRRDGLHGAVFASNGDGTRLTFVRGSNNPVDGPLPTREALNEAMRSLARSFEFIE